MNVDVGQVILTELRKVLAKSYFERVPVGTTMPFAVFKVPSIYQQQNCETLTLEIDIYDNKGTNILDLETATNNIAKSFHNKRYIDAKMLLIFEKESILHLPEPDEQLRRRQIRITVKYFNREA